MSAYRMYRSGLPSHFDVDLVHGSVNQKKEPLFGQQFALPIARGNIGQLRFQLAAAKLVPRIASRYHVFHGLQGFDVTVLPAVLAEKHGLPAVVKLAAHRSDLAAKGGLRGLLRRPRRRQRLIIDRISAVIAISTAIRDELRTYGIPERKISLIPNGVDTAVFRPCQNVHERTSVRKWLGWRDRPTILFVGGINRRKRPHLIAQAMLQMGARVRDVQLVLAGPVDDPPYLGEIRRAFSEARRREDLIQYPFTPDIAPLYRAADLFCLPSANEGMPNALLEAMASGVPCVVTDISGSSDLVTDGVTGRLTPPDPAVLASILYELITIPSAGASLAAAASQLISEKYSAYAVLNMHHELFAAIRR